MSLWRSRARLYPTHIELSGWTWTGRVVRRVPLSAIASVRWWGGKQDINLELTLANGGLVALYLEESAGTWNYTLRRLRMEMKEASANDEPTHSTHEANEPSSDGATSERTVPHWVGVAPS